MKSTSPLVAFSNKEKILKNYHFTPNESFKVLNLSIFKQYLMAKNTEPIYLYSYCSNMQNTLDDVRKLFKRFPKSLGNFRENISYLHLIDQALLWHC